MAAIGMSYAVAAPITSHTDGSTITYGTGFIAGHAVSANLTFNSNNSSDFGDDIALDTDNGITGYTLDFETNDISASVRASLLGWVPNATTATEYDLTDDASPEVGFGFLQHLVTKGVHSYDAYWCRKIRFSENNITANTKTDSVNWGHKTMNGIGVGAYIDSTGKAKYIAYMRFGTEAAAKAWLNTKAGISSST